MPGHLGVTDRIILLLYGVVSPTVRRRTPETRRCTVGAGRDIVGSQVEEHVTGAFGAIAADGATDKLTDLGFTSTF